jgi:hypothetical protein
LAGCLPGTHRLVGNLFEYGDLGAAEVKGMGAPVVGKLDCDGCALKPRCFSNAPARKILRSIHEGARDMARDNAATEAYATSRCERKKIEMLFAHLKHIFEA